jgi:hypothetical protein
MQQVLKNSSEKACINSNHHDERMNIISKQNSAINHVPAPTIPAATPSTLPVLPSKKTQARSTLTNPTRATSSSTKQASRKPKSQQTVIRGGHAAESTSILGQAMAVATIVYSIIVHLFARLTLTIVHY